MRLPIALVLLVLAAGCFTPDAGDADEAPVANESAPGAEGDAPAQPDAAPVELAVSLVERPGVGLPPKTMAIEPAHLQAEVGQLVRITVTNGGQAPHNLVIDGLVESDMIGPGESTEVEFVAAEAGEYAMWCAVGGDSPAGHRAQGMEGVFAVA